MNRPESPRPAAAARPERRRIVLSAFACSPLWGSEPGVGWQWLLEISRHHEVELITHTYFRSHLEPALVESGDRPITVHYLEVPGDSTHPHVQLNSWQYYVRWQWHARRTVRQIVRSRRVDLIHHLTWGTLRFPSFLGGLGVPFVMGPLGGGEVAPLRLFRGLPWKLQLFDALRSLSLAAVRWDPLATWATRRAQVVLCKSPESRAALPYRVQDKAVVSGEIGSPPVREDARLPPAPGARRRLLFAGRLLGWKGVMLAWGAARQLMRDGADVELVVAGDGPLRETLIAQVREAGLQDRVQVLGGIPREQLMAEYDRADLFVFPSLHDSSGNVVLEALSRGLPVVCLDLGGPQLYVDTSCGLVVSTRQRDRRGVEAALAEGIGQLLADPERLSRMQAGALAHARDQSWTAAVERAYRVFGDRLGWRDA